jgi:putative ATP-dependent endonuclease of the OLD family
MKEFEMKLHALKVKNFRSNKDETRIQFEDLTTFVGQNDAGKSSLLEALAIFFEDPSVKLDVNDATKSRLDSSSLVEISCEFSDFVDQVDIDGGAKTSLANEALLNENGRLEIKKTYECSGGKPKESIFIHCLHYSDEALNDLLQLKNSDLKARAKKLSVPETSYNASVNHEIRKAIRNHHTSKELALVSLDAAKGDMKELWPKLKTSLPMFFLFKSDRQSLDSDDEVQDPMKAAVAVALAEVKEKLAEIREIVREKSTQISTRTIEKLKHFSPDIASALNPSFADPNWASAFKISFIDQDGVPLNKRGSGVRRLILLSFFQAEADRKAANLYAPESANPNVIYAIEEPETSQHPSNQKKLIEALIDLSNIPMSQVILTTHVPALASLLPINSIRYVTKTAGWSKVQYGENILTEVALSLGVFADVSDELNTKSKVAVCVEGPTDVIFLNSVSAILNSSDAAIPNLAALDNVIVIPLGGSTLKDWVNKDYLSKFGLTEVHIYDRDDANNPKYKDQVTAVNLRGGKHKAYLTQKREMENYVHPNALKAVFGVEISRDPNIDVPEQCAKGVHELVPGSKPWNTLNKDDRKRKEAKVKRRIAEECLTRLSANEIYEMDDGDELKLWLRYIVEVSSMK